MLNHYSATGGSVWSSTGAYTTNMYGVPGLADGAYIVKRYDVRRTVHFPWIDEPAVWGRGVASTGMSSESPNFGIGYTEVISKTNSSALVRSYVYEVWATNGQYIGFRPTTPSNISFAYTAHGIPAMQPFSIQIFGNTHFGAGNQGQWWAVASGGVSPYSFTWFTSQSGSTGPWTQVGTGTTYSQQVDQEMWIKLAGSDSYSPMAFDESVIHIQVNHCGNPPCPMPKQISDFNSEPVEHALLTNYPNPFNPTTVIRYHVAEPYVVNLTVYDMLGRTIAVLVDAPSSAGRHEIRFDAASLAGGVYLVRLRVGNESFTRRMLLLK